MPPMKIQMLLLFVLFVVSTSSARIGETFDECQARYGEWKGGRDGGLLLFTKNNINAHCEFDAERRCRYIMFTAGKGLDLGLIDALLEANSGGSAWKEFEDPKTPEETVRITEILEFSKGREWAETFRYGRNWVSEDGTRWAAFRDGRLLIATTLALDAYRAAGKSKASGF